MRPQPLQHAPPRPRWAPQAEPREFVLDWVFPALGVVCRGRIPMDSRARLRWFVSWLLSELEPLRQGVAQSDTSPFSDRLPDLVSEWSRVAEGAARLPSPWLSLAEVDAIGGDLLQRTGALLSEMDDLPLRLVDPDYPRSFGLTRVFDLTTYGTVIDTVFVPICDVQRFRLPTRPDDPLVVDPSWRAARDDWVALSAEYLRRGGGAGWDQPLSRGEAAQVLDALYRLERALRRRS